MQLPKIRALDLRDREVAHEIDNYGVYWDWPEFPVDTLTFINTGIRPGASRKVKFSMVDLKLAINQLADMIYLRRKHAIIVREIQQKHYERTLTRLSQPW